MDVQLLGGVIWRHRWIVFAGFALAALLAVLSMVRFTSDGVVYRQQQQWAATSKILVTRAGFPEGSIVGSGGTADFATPRFTSLAYLYAGFLDTDPVERLIREQGPKIKGKVKASTVTAPGDNTEQLPIIGITGIAATARDSITLTQRATTALLVYVKQQQKQAKIASKNRVVVSLIQAPREAKMIHGRPLTLPIIVFLAVMALVLGIVSLLDNLAQSRRVVVDEVPAAGELPSPAQRAASGEVSAWKLHSEDVSVSPTQRSRRPR